MSTSKIATVAGKVEPAQPKKQYVVVHPRGNYKVSGNLHDTMDEAVQEFVDCYDPDDITDYIVLEVVNKFEIVKSSAYTFKEI